MSEQIKIFFGMAMSNVPLAFKETHEDNMQLLVKMISVEVKGSKVLSGNNRPAPIDRSDYNVDDNKILYRWYRDLIFESDIFVADISYPSTGLGLELHMAIMFEKPTYLFLHTQYNSAETLSRMVHGIPSLRQLVRYESIQSLKGKLSNILI